MVATTQAPPVGQPMTAEEFDEFLWQLDDELCIHYELVGGRLHQNMTEPSGQHQEIVSELHVDLKVHIRQNALPLIVQPRNVCRLLPEDKRRPDLIIIEKDIWNRETQRQAILKSIPKLIIEVVSNNWKDDYREKFDLYQEAGVEEYWIFDARLAKAKNPKIVVPTFSVCTLVGGKYQIRQYIDGQPIQSRLFPTLELSIDRVLAEAGIL